MKELSKRYDPKLLESKWYTHWEKMNYFRSEPDEREPFTIVIPPPNVTGVLHMGHMLNITIQDVLIRKARLDGKNACWVPGTDHASIATEAKVVRKLREKGIKKSDLTREEFLEYAWDWKNEYGGKILEQLKTLGASCDWERTAFTMDQSRSDAVMKVFVDLYNKGKLYRGLRMINWDPQAKTVLSNEEVLYSEESSQLYYVRYAIKDTDEYLTIATQRPETIMGDTAVAVHPDDPRYAHLKGKTAIVPLVNREVPIIFDTYVDIEFGTGALKITPAHDPNDYEIGLKHNLEVIDTIHEDGTLNESAQICIGEDRFEVRPKIKQALENAGALVKLEDYNTNIGRSERTGVIVEPKLSLQWYVDMKSLAKPALEAVLSDDVQFFPKKYQNVYRHWMENLRDWCISRQLWWGHRVPAWYVGKEVFVAETKEEALSQARKKLNNPALKPEDLEQDEDVLDTWFSSWLWPISVFNGFKDRKELDYYYPTSVLVTGWDIIFLWVARMIMSGFEWENKKPFNHVYFTGMVRDKLGRKMSKSLGNSPDALQLMKDYGADGVRYGMLSCSPAGGDLLFEEKLCENGRNFCNKIWNALRLIHSFDVDEDVKPGLDQELAMVWFKHKLNQVIESNENNYSGYRLSSALKNLYSFIWNDFCSWYLEMIKPGSSKKMNRICYDATIEFFEQLMIMLHPYLPFITEEIWHHLKDRVHGDDCMISAYPSSENFDVGLIKHVEEVKVLIKNIRDIRNKNGIPMKEEIHLYVSSSKDHKMIAGTSGTKELLLNMANLSAFDTTETEIDAPNQVSFLSGDEKYILVIEKEIDVEAEKERITKELEYAKGFVMSVEKKLENERFVNNAPASVVEVERRKLEDGKKRIFVLEENLKGLN